MLASLPRILESFHCSPQQRPIFQNQVFLSSWRFRVRTCFLVRLENNNCPIPTSCAGTQSRLGPCARLRRHRSGVCLESLGHALRARFFSKYVAPLYTNNKAAATEACSRRFPWGLMQMMGQVARETGRVSPSAAKACARNSTLWLASRNSPPPRATCSMSARKTPCSPTNATMPCASLAAAAPGAASAAPPSGFSLASLPAPLPPKPPIDTVFAISALFLRYNPRTESL
jgi:hypothetical protein